MNKGVEQVESFVVRDMLLRPRGKYIGHGKIAVVSMVNAFVSETLDNDVIVDYVREKQPKKFENLHSAWGQL